MAQHTAQGRREEKSLISNQLWKVTPNYTAILIFKLQLLCYSKSSIESYEALLDGCWFFPLSTFAAAYLCFYLWNAESTARILRSNLSHSALSQGYWYWVLTWQKVWMMGSHALISKASIWMSCRKDTTFHFTVYSTGKNSCEKKLVWVQLGAV